MPASEIPVRQMSSRRSDAIPASGDLAVSVTVRNSGTRAGEEVVQLYAHDPVASVSRPVRQLRGFRRIALAPGEAKRVTFVLSAAQFAKLVPKVPRTSCARVRRSKSKASMVCEPSSRSRRPSGETRGTE